MSEPSSHTAVLDPILERYRRRPTYLLQILREAQVAWNHLPPAALTYIASALGLPRSRVEGVASFYSFLHTRPAGRYRPPPAPACATRDRRSWSTSARSRA